MFKAGDFDMVSLFQTAEHVPEPVMVLKEIHRILKEDGYCYLICHNYRALLNRIMGIKSPIYDIEHLQIFSRKSICRAMRKAGFREMDVFTIRNRYPLTYWLRLLPIPASVKKQVLTIAEKLGAEKVLLSINVGNIGVIARKQL